MPSNLQNLKFFNIRNYYCTKLGFLKGCFSVTDKTPEINNYRYKYTTYKQWQIQ